MTWYDFNVRYMSFYDIASTDNNSILFYLSIVLYVAVFLVLFAYTLQPTLAMRLLENWIDTLTPDVIDFIIGDVQTVCCPCF